MAGVAEIPAFNPVDAPQAALDRQKQVIQAMLDQKLISFEQAVQAQQEPLVFRTGALPAFNPAPAFTNLVLEQLNGQFNHQRLERGGFRVITTLDYNLQLQAACSAATQLAAIRVSPGKLAGLRWLGMPGRSFIAYPVCRKTTPRSPTWKPMWSSWTRKWARSWLWLGNPARRWIHVRLRMSLICLGAHLARS